MINQDSCGSMIKQIHDELEKRCNNALRPHDLTMSQLWMLLALDESASGELSLKEVEQILHVAQSTNVGIAYRLEQKGFVMPYNDENDKRIKRLRITSAGEERCEEAESEILLIDDAILDCFNDDERDVFVSMLKRVRSSLCSR